MPKILISAIYRKSLLTPDLHYISLHFFWYVHTVEYYSAMQTNELQLHGTILINLTHIMSERGQKQITHTV